MTIYLNKDAEDLDVEEEEGGPDPTAFAFDTDHLDAKGYRHDADGNLNYWRWPIGTQLDHTMDFMFRVWFTTQPTNMEGTNSSALYIGYKNSTDGFTQKDGLMFWISGKYPTGVGGRAGNSIFYTDETSIPGSTNYDLAPATDYIADVIFNSTTHIATLIIYDSDEQTLATIVTPSIEDNIFAVDVLGFYGFTSKGGSTTGSFYEPIAITRIQGNSGLTFDNSTLPSAPQTLRVHPNKTNMYIDWVAPSDLGGGIDEYSIYRGTVEGEETLLTTVPSTETSYEDLVSDLSRNTTYYYYVTATNGAGESDPSSTVSDTVDLNLPLGMLQNLSETIYVHEFDSTYTDEGEKEYYNKYPIDARIETKQTKYFKELGGEVIYSNARIYVDGHYDIDNADEIEFSDGTTHRILNIEYWKNQIGTQLHMVIYV